METVLGKLMAPITAGELRERSRQIAAARSIPEAKVAQYLQDTYQLSLPVDSTEGQAFTARMAKLIRQARPFGTAGLERPPASTDHNGNCGASCVDANRQGM